MVTHLLVGNPTAQSGKNAARIERARSLLATHGIASDLLATLPGGKTVGAVTEALDRGGYSCVVTMGGDGTFREVASGLLGSARGESIAMGMLPTGTANDQGRSFGLEAGEAALERNVEVVAAAKETRLDAGRIEAARPDASVQSAYFFDSAGWGLSARVLAERNAEREAVQQVPILRDVYRDYLVYASSLLKVFLDSYTVNDKFTCEVEHESGTERLEGLTDLIVKGTRVYGGAWVFDRGSRHDDGLFEVIPFRGKRDWTSKAIVDLEGNPVTEEMLNQIGVEHSHSFRVARATLRFRPPEGGAPLAAQIDGEEFLASTQARIEVLPRAVRLIVP